MLDIKKVDDVSINKVKEFLMSVPSIQEIDDGILRNAIYVSENGDILGAISYEKFDVKGIIRYFVFKRILEEDVISRLFEQLKAEGVKNKVKILYCVVDNDVIEELFLNLGFKRVENKVMYIDEKPFQMLNYNNARIMEYKGTINLD